MIFYTKPENFSAEISVVACYIKHDGKFILLQRQPSKIQGRRWGLPAGKIDSGEDCETAMVREIFEETGISIDKRSLERLQTLWVENEGHQIEYHTFAVDLPSLVEIKLSASEHQAYMWIEPGKSLDMDLVHDLSECNRFFFKL